MRGSNVFTIAPDRAFLDTLVDSAPRRKARRHAGPERSVRPRRHDALSADPPRRSRHPRQLPAPRRAGGAAAEDPHPRRYRRGRSGCSPKVRAGGPPSRRPSRRWSGSSSCRGLCSPGRARSCGRRRGCRTRSWRSRPRPPTRPISGASSASSWIIMGATSASGAALLENLDADLARYWEITREFLAIVAEAWPNASRRARPPRSRRPPRPLDPRGGGAARDARLPRAGYRGRLDRLRPGDRGTAGCDRRGCRTARSSCPASISGSTMPAGRRSRRRNVTLPAAGHPQYGLKKLLERLRHRPRRCRRARSGRGDARERASSPRRCGPPRPPSAGQRSPSSPPPRRTRRFRASSVVEAPNEREEALTVAAILREAVETPGRVAALVTPDRGLARRVAVELRRWSIDVDDSAGEPAGPDAAGGAGAAGRRGGDCAAPAPSRCWRSSSIRSPRSGWTRP